MGHSLEVITDEASFKALGCQVILVAGDNASYGQDWMERYVNIEQVYTIDLLVRLRYQIKHHHISVYWSNTPSLPSLVEQDSNIDTFQHMVIIT